MTLFKNIILLITISLLKISYSPIFINLVTFIIVCRSAHILFILITLLRLRFTFLLLLLIIIQCHLKCSSMNLYLLIIIWIVLFTLSGGLIIDQKMLINQSTQFIFNNPHFLLNILINLVEFSKQLQHFILN